MNVTNKEVVTKKIINGKFDHHGCLQSAKESSPLRVMRDLKMRLKMTEDKLENVTMDMRACINELGATRNDLGNERCSHAETKDQLQKERIRRTQSDTTLHGTFKNFVDKQWCRYKALRKSIFVHHQSADKNTVELLRADISAHIKEIEIQHSNAEIMSPKLGENCEELLRRYNELLSWLPQSACNPRVVRHHSVR